MLSSELLIRIEDSSSTNHFENLPSILQKLSDWKLAYLNEDTNEYELTHLEDAEKSKYYFGLKVAEQLLGAVFFGTVKPEDVELDIL